MKKTENTLYTCDFKIIAGVKEPRVGSKLRKGDMRTVIMKATDSGYACLTTGDRVYFAKGATIKVEQTWDGFAWDDKFLIRTITPPPPSFFKRFWWWLIGKDRVPRARTEN